MLILMASLSPSVYVCTHTHIQRESFGGKILRVHYTLFWIVGYYSNSDHISLASISPRGQSKTNQETSSSSLANGASDSVVGVLSFGPRASKPLPTVSRPSGQAQL